LKKFASGPFFKNEMLHWYIQKNITETLKTKIKSLVNNSCNLDWIIFLFPSPFRVTCMIIILRKIMWIVCIFLNRYTMTISFFFICPPFLKIFHHICSHPLFQKLPEKKSTQTIFVMTKVYFCNRYFLPNRRLQKKNQKYNKKKVPTKHLKKGQAQKR